VSGAPAGKIRLTREHARELLHGMILIRRFEEKSAELYSQEKIRGFLHLYIGEEANAVGIMQALAADEALVATYREHGQALLRGLPPGEVMAELYGKASGSSHGRGGSMHIFDVSRRFYGGNAIVGGGLPVAVGLALADKMLGNNRVTCCCFGEGAVAEGEFHESLNLAGLWKLPVLFVCENNRYAMGTVVERSLAVPEVHLHAGSYGIPAQVVDGMDVVEVEAAARRAVAAIRDGGGPQLLESRTYRFCAHSMFDAELYRDKAEVEYWKSRCPIRSFSTWLQQNSLLHEQDVAEIESDVAAIIAQAVAFAEAAPWEPIEQLTRDVTTPHPAQLASP
jgi:pyruvate dehydrogenase E1 component alpha subunit